MGNLLLIGAGSGASTLCENGGDILQFIGYVFLIFKIAIPVLLIVLGSIDLGKAVVAQAEDEIKKATGILVKRAIAGVIIFFIPSIVGVIFGMIGDFQDSAEVKDNYKDIKECIIKPSDCSCSK